MAKIRCQNCNDKGYILGLETACPYCNPDGSWRSSQPHKQTKNPVITNSDEPNWPEKYLPDTTAYADGRHDAIDQCITAFHEWKKTLTVRWPKKKYCRWHENNSNWCETLDRKPCIVCARNHYANIKIDACKKAFNQAIGGE